MAKVRLPAQCGRSEARLPSKNALAGEGRTPGQGACNAEPTAPD